jgi:hypothetical protein
MLLGGPATLDSELDSRHYGNRGGTTSSGGRFLTCPVGDDRSVAEAFEDVEYAVNGYRHRQPEDIALQWLLVDRTVVFVNHFAGHFSRAELAANEALRPGQAAMTLLCGRGSARLVRLWRRRASSSQAD